MINDRKWYRNRLEKHQWGDKRRRYWKPQRRREGWRGLQGSGGDKEKPKHVKATCGPSDVIMKEDKEEVDTCETLNMDWI